MFAKSLDDTGTAAIEFALIGPLFLLLVLGSFNLAWALHSIQSVQYATSKAVRVLELHPSTSSSDLQVIIRNELVIENQNDVYLTLEIDPPDGGVKLAHATVEFPLVVWIPFFGSYSLTRSTTVTVPLRLVS